MLIKTLVACLLGSSMLILASIILFLCPSHASFMLSAAAAMLYYAGLAVALYLLVKRMPKERWSTVEKIVILMNGAVALLILYFFVLKFFLPL
jgi:hypothetical protein